MTRSLLRWIWLPVVAAVVVVLDQWTKGLVEANIPLYGSVAPFPALAKYFNIVHWQNSGAAFGLLQGQAGLFMVVAVVVIVAILMYARYLPTDNWAIRAILGLQLGGAIGNLIDRLQHQGMVTDFLLFMVPIGDRVYQWPAWNVADASLVVGSIMLALLLLWSEREETRTQGPATTEAAGCDGDQASDRITP